MRSDILEQARALRRATQEIVRYAPDDVAAVQPRTLYDVWTAGNAYAKDALITQKGGLYRVVQEVTAIESQPPGAEGMLAIHRPIDASHAGTADDPIPWVYGMDCDKEKHYSYNGTVYLCVGEMKPCVWAPDTAGLWQWKIA